MYETPQKNLSLTLQMTEISDIYPSNFGQWYHPRGSITIFVIYQFELGMTQRLIWHMTQVSATKSFVGTTQIKCVTFFMKMFEMRRVATLRNRYTVLTRMLQFAMLLLVVSITA